MIKYFDFETEIEKIDNLLAELQSENKDNSNKIKKLKRIGNLILKKNMNELKNIIL